MEITDKIRNYIIENAYADIDKIEDSTLIFHEGLLDSMGFIKLITFIQDEFDIQILDDDIMEENFESISAISKYVIGKISNMGKGIPQ